MTTQIHRRLESLLLPNYHPDLAEKAWLLSQEELVRKTEDQALIALWEQARNCIVGHEEKLIRDITVICGSKRGDSPLKTSGELRLLKEDFWKQCEQMLESKRA